jgi:septal ring factor EnvC (AmiA/AmiB activator)
MTLMKKIKNNIIWIIASLLAVFGIYIFASKKINAKKADKIQDQIDDNKQDIDVTQGRIDAIEDQKQDVQDTINHREDVIEDLKQQAEEVAPEEKTDVAEAKENILNKTKRRGRKPKKKS